MDSMAALLKAAADNTGTAEESLRFVRADGACVCDPQGTLTLGHLLSCEANDLPRQAPRTRPRYDGGNGWLTGQSRPHREIEHTTQPQCVRQANNDSAAELPAPPNEQTNEQALTETERLRSIFVNLEDGNTLRNTEPRSMTG